jgi:PPOX class probable F420-dependent enzyme
MIMRTGLTIDDLGDLVELPLLAVLATYRRNGTVLLSPVWHEWRDAAFNVATASDGINARHLRPDPSASIVVREPTPPYRAVEARCKVRLVTAGVETATARIATRYLGAEAGFAYAATSRDDLLLRIEPEALRVWGFADEYP